MKHNASQAYNIPSYDSPCYDTPNFIVSPSVTYIEGIDDMNK